MTKVMLNGKEYKAKDLDFNAMCELEDMGIDLMSQDAGKKGLNTIRTMLAVILSMDELQAGKLITSHIKRGGNIEDINHIINKALEDGGFLAQAAEMEKLK